MARDPFAANIIEFPEPGKVVINGIGKSKVISLPVEVVEWLKESYAGRAAVRELVTHYKFRQRLTHPGALRSLILLLYARARREAPYRVARRYGVAPEQLYRIERGMKKDNLYEYVMNLLQLHGEGGSKT
ncbi:hypothetical protein [Stetteria hydrogenophila]